MSDMANKGAKARRGEPATGAELGCCRVEAMVAVDDRGQMVLPKEVRERAGIRPGDKLAITVIQGEGGGVCCIALMRADVLSKMVKGVLGPVMKEVL
jgi:AbrB family looped-hinge helix DNA binding protein